MNRSQSIPTAAMESDEVRWLRKHYHKTESEDPRTKRMKFETIHSEMSAHFAGTMISNHAVARAIKSAFPQAVTKRYGHDWVFHIFGLEATQTKDLEAQLTRQLQINSELMLQVKQLEERMHHADGSKVPKSSGVRGIFIFPG